MTSTMISLNIEAQSRVKDLLTDFLLGIDAQGVSESPAEQQKVTINALFPAGTDIDSVVCQIRDYEKLIYRQIPGKSQESVISYKFIDHSSWDIWKKMLGSVRIGNRIIIHPPWEKPRTEGNKIVLEINPSLAFGTGHHETTRNCLLAIQQICEQFRVSKMIDVGCGSGVLGIAAVKLGVERVTAFDTDLLALKETRSNINKNQVSGYFDIFCGTIDCLEKPDADLAVANISLGSIQRMRRKLFSCINNRGFVIISGITLASRPETLNMIKQEGMKVVEEKTEDEWLTIIISQ